MMTSFQRWYLHATILFAVFAAIEVIFAEDKKESKTPVEARLIVKQSTYILPKDRHGMTFRQQIEEETDCEKLPPAPRVDLILELKNVSDEDVMIWPRGSITYPDVFVEGKGVVEPVGLRSFSGSSAGTSLQPTIKPGMTYRTEIKSLNPRGDTPSYFWCEPGEYSINATYVVHTGLPPFPFPRGPFSFPKDKKPKPEDKKPKAEPKRYEVTTPPVKVQVVLEEAQRPLIVAHRGLLRHAPENTLANFRACLEMRIGFEFDVQKTSDRQLVCIHDDTVDRTTDGVGYVSDFSLDQLRRLDAGRWFDPRFAGEKVPTVEEVLQLIAKYRQHDILVAVDLKEGDFADPVAEDVVRLAEKHKVLDRLLFIGTTIRDDFVREEIKAASKSAQTAVVANKTEEFAAAVKASDGDWVYFRYVPTAKEIETVHKAKKLAFIAGPTVGSNLPDNWRKAASAGIDAVLTDYPLELRKVLSTNKPK